MLAIVYFMPFFVGKFLLFCWREMVHVWLWLWEHRKSGFLWLGSNIKGLNWNPFLHAITHCFYCSCVLDSLCVFSVLVNLGLIKDKPCGKVGGDWRWSRRLVWFSIIVGEKSHLPHYYSEWQNWWGEIYPIVTHFCKCVCEIIVVSYFLSFWWCKQQRTEREIGKWNVRFSFNSLDVFTWKNIYTMYIRS